LLAHQISQEFQIGGVVRTLLARGSSHSPEAEFALGVENPSIRAIPCTFGLNGIREVVALSARERVVAVENANVLATAGAQEPRAFAAEVARRPFDVDFVDAMDRRLVARPPCVFERYTVVVCNSKKTMQRDASGQAQLKGFRFIRLPRSEEPKNVYVQGVSGLCLGAPWLSVRAHCGMLR
jgi:hypothetical protein